jgi:osmotically-inducible protein OsmY
VFDEEVTMAIARTLAVLTLVGFLAAACQSTTGRTAGQWTDDKATTARVKTALAATKIGTLTRVDVDTLEGVVSLRGKVESEDVKRRAGEVAESTSGRPVINNLVVDRGLAGDPARDTTPSASPTTR